MTIFEYFYDFLNVHIFGTNFISTDFGSWCSQLGAVILCVCTLCLVYKFFKSIIKATFKLW